MSLIPITICKFPKEDKEILPTRASRSSRVGKQRSLAGSMRTKVKQPVRKITREGHITCAVTI